MEWALPPPPFPYHVVKKLPQIEENNAKVKQQAAEPTPEVKPAAMSDELWQKITQLKKQSTETADSNSVTDNCQSVSSQMSKTPSSFQNVDNGSQIQPSSIIPTNDTLDFSEDFTLDELPNDQNIRIMFTDGSRLVCRLSGTGSSGATVR